MTWADRMPASHVSDGTLIQLMRLSSLFLDTESPNPINVQVGLNPVCISSWDFLIINLGFSLALMSYCVVCG